MAKGDAEDDRSAVLQNVRDLVAVAQVDTLYRDLFLQRAIEKLRGVLWEAAYSEALAGVLLAGQIASRGGF